MQQTRVDLFVCPGCCTQFQVIWPDPIPDYLCNQSKVGLTCPVCHDSFELFAFLIDFCKTSLPLNLPFIEITSISGRTKQPVPENARMEWMRVKWDRQREKYKAVYTRP
jgi:hypothetical protein